MTNATNINAAGARQRPEYLTLEISATEFSGASAAASTLTIGSLPPGAVVVDVSLGIGTAFNGGGNDTLDIGFVCDLSSDGSADTDTDGIFDGAADNLGAAGAVVPIAATAGVYFGRKLPNVTTLTATYTPAAAAASAGSVRVNIGYIGAARADAVYGS